MAETRAALEALKLVQTLLEHADPRILQRSHNMVVGFLGMATVTFRLGAKQWVIQAVENVHESTPGILRTPATLTGKTVDPTTFVKSYVSKYPSVAVEYIDVNVPQANDEDEYFTAYNRGSTANVTKNMRQRAIAKLKRPMRRYVASRLNAKAAALSARARRFRTP